MITSRTNSYLRLVKYPLTVTYDLRSGQCLISVDQATAERAEIPEGWDLIPDGDVDFAVPHCAYIVYGVHQAPYPMRDGGFSSRVIKTIK